MKKLITLIPNKKIIYIFIAFALIIGAGGSVGVYQYNQKILATQIAYHELQLPVTTELYTENELNEYNSLLDKKNYLFDKLDVLGLENLQNEIIQLDTTIQTKNLASYIKQKKSEVEKLTVENANEEELKEFKKQKEALLRLFNEGISVDTNEFPSTDKRVYVYMNGKKVIDDNIVKLKEEQKKVSDAVAKREEEARLQAERETQNDNSYYDTSDDDYYYGGGGGSGGSGSGGSGAGGGGSNPSNPTCGWETVLVEVITHPNGMQQEIYEDVWVCR